MGDNASTSPVNAPGGAGSTQVDSLDLADRKDCRLLNKAARRWKLSTRFMARVPAALEAALDMAENAADYKAIAVIASTAATLEGQNQKDEQVAAEAEKGPSGNVTVIVERVARKPLPDQGDSPALPPRPVADDRERATIQRGHVRATLGEDDDGGVSGG